MKRAASEVPLFFCARSVGWGCPCAHQPSATCRQYHQLEGRELQLQQLIEAEYASALAANAAAVAAAAGGADAVDERAETHYQCAALVLATHKVLLPFLRDEQEVLKVRTELYAASACSAFMLLMCG